VRWRPSATTLRRRLTPGTTSTTMVGTAWPTGPCREPHGASSGKMKAGGKPLSFRMQLVEQSPTGTLIKGEFSLDGGPWVPVMDVVETKLAKTK